MNHLLPVGARRAAACTGALAVILAACTACVGSSTPASGTSNTASAPATGTGATGTPGGASTPAAGASTGAPAGAASSPAAGGGGSTGSGGGSGPQPCLTQNLTATTANPGAAAGSDYVDLVFKNVGGEACTMYGYPGVSFGAGGPVQQVGQPASRDPQVSPLIVTLIPNAHAFAQLQIADAGNYPQSTCRPTATTELRVYPPNNNTLLYVPYTSTGCAGNEVTLRIEAVQPGTGS
jgi:hypothetical protein